MTSPPPRKRLRLFPQQENVSQASLEEGTPTTVDIETQLAVPSTSRSLPLPQSANQLVDNANNSSPSSVNLSTSNSSMHTFGVANGSNEEHPSSNSDNIFTNGDVPNNHSATNTSTAPASSNGNISNGAETNGENNSNFTNGDNNEQDDYDAFDEDGRKNPIMNGGGPRKNAKKDKFIARSTSEFEMIRLIGQQLCIMGLE